MRSPISGLALGLTLAVASAAAGWPGFAAAQSPAPYTASMLSNAPPARAGRIAESAGSVWVFQQDRGEWVEAPRNRPVTSGDRISTGQDARVELRVGSTVLRLGARTELEVALLDDHRLVLQLHTGSMALRLRTRDWADQVEVSTLEARLKPLQAGHYRIDRNDAITSAGTWRGDLLVDEATSFAIGAGQRMDFWFERGVRQTRQAGMPQDALQAWAAAEDQRDERSQTARQVSPEMTGAEDLDRFGRWDQTTEYGTVWFPSQLQAGWAPYVFGSWVWVRHWGWVWVDNQPWGFAPFHYGRWVQWRGRWGWVPGNYSQRPVFAPAPRPPHMGPPPVHTPRPIHPGPALRPDHTTRPLPVQSPPQPAHPGRPHPATPSPASEPPRFLPHPGLPSPPATRPPPVPTPQPVIVPPGAVAPAQPHPRPPAPQTGRPGGMQEPSGKAPVKDSERGEEPRKRVPEQKPGNGDRAAFR